MPRTGFRFATLLAFLWSLALQGQVLIGEVDAFGTLTDALGEEEDWIEVWNAGNQPASLEGLFLSDDGSDWGKWPLPALTLDPDERLVFFASGRDVRSLDHWEGTVRDIDLWRYHIPQAQLTSDWRRPEFNDDGWALAPGGFGYGDGDDITDVEDANVVFLRREFTVEELPLLMHGLFAVDYDDGCVAFINGRELFRSQTMSGPETMPGSETVSGHSIAFDAWTNGLHEAELYQGGVPEHIAFDPREWLVEGENVLAIQVHNESATSSDLTIRPFLALGHHAPNPAPFNAIPNWMEVSDPGLHTNDQRPHL